MLEAIFDEITAQLEAQELKIKGGSIVIIETTGIQSAACPIKKPTDSKVREDCTDRLEQQ